MPHSPQDTYDCWEECFHKITPSLVETFSFDSRPCRFEAPILTAPARKGNCPFRDDCSNIDTPRPGDRSLNDIFRDAYSESVKNVQTEPSTSVVIRSEQQFHGQDLRRFALRRHLYEVVRREEDGDPNRLGPGCTELKRGDRLGEYIGLIDLRQHFHGSSLAMGLLAAPGWIREDPSIFLIQGYYSTLFGGGSFRSTVYSMQDRGTAGAVCAQMCVIMVSGLLSDRGALVRGSFNLTYEAWRREIGRAKLKKLHQNKTTLLGASVAHFEVRGLRPDETAGVLSACNVKAQESIVSESGPVGDRLVTRLIEANVYARYPIILSVDAATWSRMKLKKDTGHAVVVVGVKQNSFESSGVDELIIHDPGSGPFQKQSIAHCLDAARRFYRKASKRVVDGTETVVPKGSINIIAAGCRSIETHAATCVAWLRDRRSEPTPRSPDADPDPRFVPYFNVEPNTNYRIRLLNRNTVARYLSATMGSQYFEELKQHLRECPEDCRFWSVIGLRRKSRWQKLFNDLSARLTRKSVSRAEASEVHDVWLFDAGKPPGSRPVLVVRREIGGNFTFEPSNAYTPVVKPNSSAGPTTAVTTSRTGGEPVDNGKPLIVASVMTSSSERGLEELFSEIDKISGCNHFDLMLARRTDLSEVGIDTTGYKGMAEIIADSTNCDALSAHYQEAVTGSGACISAIATYFPAATSVDKSRRMKAVDAIVNAIRLALDLQEATGGVNHAIVEIVCGTILEPHPQTGILFVYHPVFKLRLLCDSLRRAIKRVMAERPDAHFGIALELEPGETYLLNNVKRMKWLANRFCSPQNSKGQKNLLHGKVGFNIDIAHMRIQRISACDLREFEDLIVHAHISDHPRMHTHDQIVGSWTNLISPRTGYHHYLHLLMDRAEAAKKAPVDSLPFSGAVALELEGCNRIMAIHDSLSRMNHSIKLSGRCRP